MRGRSSSTTGSSPKSDPLSTMALLSGMTRTAASPDNASRRARSVSGFRSTRAMIVPRANSCPCTRNGFVATARLKPSSSSRATTRIDDQFSAPMR